MTKKKEVNWEKVRTDFIGNGKIQAIRVEKTGDGRFALFYRESNGKKTEKIYADDKRELDKLLIEFGGKNPETVSAPDLFLTIPGWTANDLEEKGHRIQKITVSGYHTSRDNKYPIDIPTKCGHPVLLNSKKETSKKEVTVNLLQIDKEKVDITVSFVTGEEFDNLLKFISDHPMLHKLTWAVKTIVTYSVDTGSFCKWVRASAGDGSKRMVLELERLDGTHYNDCIHYDLVAAADGLIGGECRKIPDKRKVSKDRLICEIFATA